MRSIGNLPSEAQARLFGDYLLAHAIANDVEPADDAHWAIWVHDDDQLPQAQTLLEAFRKNPADPKYAQAAPLAREKREQEKQSEAAWRKRLHDRRTVWKGGPFGIGAVTSALVSACVVVMIYKWLRGDSDPLIRMLFITDIQTDGDYFRYTRGLPEFRGGQFWRVFTPILIHFDVLHLFFNMMGLIYLGGMIEARHNGFRLAVKILAFAAATNLAQYAWHNPNFGGMSGVVFGLFGYVWVRSKLDPQSGFYIDPTNVILMVFWFFLCMTDLVGPIANMAHAVGLGSGLIWGFLAAKLNR